MGHVRLGRLPKSVRWSAVVRLLQGDRVAADDLSRATLHAAQRQLRELASDESFSYPFWLLVRVSWASRSEDFETALADLGIPATASTAGLTFVSMVSDRVRAEAERQHERSAFGQIAALALNRTLNEELKEGQRGLFESTTQSLQHSMRRLSKLSHFERAAQRYFGDFLARTLTSQYDVEARFADLRQLAIRANIEKVVAELYGRPKARTLPVDPAPYVRYVWNGLHI